MRERTDLTSVGSGHRVICSLPSRADAALLARILAAHVSEAARELAVDAQSCEARLQMLPPRETYGEHGEHSFESYLISKQQQLLRAERKLQVKRKADDDRSERSATRRRRDGRISPIIPPPLFPRESIRSINRPAFAPPRVVRLDRASTDADADEPSTFEP